MGSTNDFCILSRFSIPTSSTLLYLVLRVSVGYQLIDQNVLILCKNLLRYTSSNTMACIAQLPNYPLASLYKYHFHPSSLSLHYCVLGYQFTNETYPMRSHSVIYETDHCGNFARYCQHMLCAEGEALSRTISCGVETTMQAGAVAETVYMFGEARGVLGTLAMGEKAPSQR